MTRVTFHQPNFCPGASVVSKVLACDAVVWMDTVQWTKGGFTNRNRLPDGSWVTVPVAHGSSFAPINRVRVGEPRGGWRDRVCGQLRGAWPGGVTEQVCREVMRGYPLLVGLNAAILRVLLDALDYRGEQHWQSHLDDAHAVQAVSEQRAQLAPISERIASMVAALGGGVYVSGPSGRNYLDESPFHERGIAVDYWEHRGPNPCALELVDQRLGVAA